MSIYRSLILSLVAISLTACGGKKLPIYQYQPSPEGHPPATISEAKIDSGRKGLIGSLTGKTSKYRIEIERINGFRVDGYSGGELRRFHIAPGPQKMVIELWFRGKGRRIPVEFSAMRAENYHFVGQMIERTRLRLFVVNHSGQAVYQNDFFHNGQTDLNPVIEMKLE